jgi:hypothetical protein
MDSEIAVRWVLQEAVYDANRILHRLPVLRILVRTMHKVS